jgi:hypothetical protein
LSTTAITWKLVRQFESHAINVGGNVRAPLVGEFRDKASGQSFLFMVNHLYHSSAERQHYRARVGQECYRAGAVMF